MVDPLEADFPRLTKGSYYVTSPRSKKYNCIAWAAGQNAKWWWPLPVSEEIQWPEGVPREESIRAFQAAFASLGYMQCETPDVEFGFEKIAVFANNYDAPTHATRQLQNGWWTSKLGRGEDIEHALHDLEGDAYGKVVLLMKRPAKPVLGLIGGIGSGKSRVAAELARRGAAVVSGDQLGHEALRRPEVRAQVIGRWGPEITSADGEIDRKKLGAIVFADPGQRGVLETIVFPWIERGIAEQVAAAQTDPAAPFVVLDAAILLEAGWNRFCNRIVYVHAPPEMRRARIAQQRGWTEKEVQAREQAQLPLTDKQTRADATIDNTGTPDELARQITQLLTAWRFPVAT